MYSTLLAVRGQRVERVKFEKQNSICACCQVEVPGQLRIVLTSSAVGSNKRQHFDSQAAREVFPPDVEVPAAGGDVTLVLPDGSTLTVSPGPLSIGFSKLRNVEKIFFCIFFCYYSSIKPQLKEIAQK